MTLSGQNEFLAAGGRQLHTALHLRLPFRPRLGRAQQGKPVWGGTPPPILGTPPPFGRETPCSKALLRPACGFAHRLSVRGRFVGAEGKPREPAEQDCTGSEQKLATGWLGESTHGFLA